MDTAAKLPEAAGAGPHRAAGQQPPWPWPPGAARGCWVWKDEVGILAPGLKADLVVIDLDQPHLTPLYDPFSHLVYAATGADVQTVVVQGKVLVEDRRLLAFDLAETLARARELGRKVRQTF